MSSVLFDRIIVVDWSARSSPSTGADSIWIAVADQDGIDVANPPTRRVALGQIAEAVAVSGRTLLGVDFSLGFPEGTAEALSLVGPPWRAMWELLGAEVVDDERNRNNRFAVASRLNERIRTTSTGPFWGCPPSQRSAHLASTKPADRESALPEWRHVERRLRCDGLRPFSAWQLLGAGAVGSQSLVGIAALERLRWNLGERCSVWPLGTGFVDPRETADDAIIVAEVWPSRWPVEVPAGMVKDAAQVSATARRLVDMDRLGTLSELFTPTIDAGEVDAVRDEEGWILGVS